ncbi:YhcN/YlaJ family sporulation lipoprotein [Oceanobacillus rekensis]|uniref:YhcN/YlaJ family sporulation lipoprotein n=1 Tax=Oceanobacillus rekensis TaxID=937927 RepID=UPI000B446D5F|nr:YhcN/YlaJ family sporulation lipoprotein [Oceanobacillus rekensis]
MKYKLMSIFAVLFLTLVACQNTDETGLQDAGTNGNDNAEQTRYNNNHNNTGDGLTGVRNNTMDRDADQMQNRGTNVNDENRNNQYDVSEEAAERITSEIKDVDRVQVLTTDNNAYVAASIDNKNDQNQNRQNNGDGEEEVNEETKQKIGDIVRSVDNNIENVYVSSNPDFIDLTNNYVDDMNNGEPIEGFFDQMGNMIQRIFPQNN